MWPIAFSLVAIITCSSVKNKKNIVCWGDSLTAPSGGVSLDSNDDSYPSCLYKMLKGNYGVVNVGVGGEDTKTIMGRQGSAPFLLAHDIIFDKRISKIIIGAEDNPPFISSIDSSYVYPLLQGGQFVNPIEIQGRFYKLSCESKVSVYENKRHRHITYSLERLDNIESEDTLRTYSTITTEAMRSLRGQYANVFFIGENDGFSDANDLIRQINLMISYSNCQRYVVVSFHQTNMTVPTIEMMTAMEESLSKEFGTHFLNLRKALIKDGISYSGLRPSSEDSTAIEKGKVPPSLLKEDRIHFTKSTKKFVADLVFKKMKDLKYID